MRLRALLVNLGLGLAVSLTGAQARETVAVPSWAQSLLRAFYFAYDAGDAAGVAKLFTAGATLGPDKGRDAIEADLKQAFAKTTYRCSGGYEAFREIGDLAVAWGVDTCMETPKGGGRPTSTRERWLIVFERQAGGGWLISRETWEALPP